MQLAFALVCYFVWLHKIDGYSFVLILVSPQFLLLDIDLEIFFEASEDWNSAMTLSNSMAFISQFGEVRYE